MSKRTRAHDAARGSGLRDAEFTRLLEFRTTLRRFERWSADQAAAHGLSVAQHQLLLAVRGHPSGRPTVGDVARYLLVQHHSAVGLVDRVVSLGLIERLGDEHDHRVVRLALTPDGERRIAELSEVHWEELRRLSGSSSDLAGVGDAPR